MANDLIRYDLLVQEALCGVVKKVLGDVAKHGLPGDHHFYITFRTHAPGVRLSSRMRELYPEEMTIILQHQFENLRVTDHALEVGLSFKGIPEVLLIPFDALTGFFDPSVQFSAKFEPHTPMDEDDDDTVVTTPGPSSLTKLPTPAAGGPMLSAVSSSDGRSTNGKTLSDKTLGDKTLGDKTLGERPPPEDDEDAEKAKVVSIDAFRKKP